MDTIKRGKEFKKWLVDCVQNARDQLGMPDEEIIICIQEMLNVLILAKYAKDIREEQQDKS